VKKYHTLTPFLWLYTTATRHWGNIENAKYLKKQLNFFSQNFQGFSTYIAAQHAKIGVGSWWKFWVRGWKRNLL